MNGEGVEAVCSALHCRLLQRWGSQNMHSHGGDITTDDEEQQRMNLNKMTALHLPLVDVRNASVLPSWLNPPSITARPIHG
jgi:hypothetical protein